MFCQVPRSGRCITWMSVARPRISTLGWRREKSLFLLKNENRTALIFVSMNPLYQWCLWVCWFLCGSCDDWVRYTCFMWSLFWDWSLLVGDLQHSDSWGTWKCICMEEIAKIPYQLGVRGNLLNCACGRAVNGNRYCWLKYNSMLSHIIYGVEDKPVFWVLIHLNWTMWETRAIGGRIHFWNYGTCLHDVSLVAW